MMIRRFVNSSKIPCNHSVSAVASDIDCASAGNVEGSFRFNLCDLNDKIQNGAFLCSHGSLVATPAMNPACECPSPALFLDAFCIHAHLNSLNGIRGQEHT